MQDCFKGMELIKIYAAIRYESGLNANTCRYIQRRYLQLSTMRNGIATRRERDLGQEGDYPRRLLEVNREINEDSLGVVEKVLRSMRRDGGWEEDDDRPTGRTAKVMRLEAPSWGPNGCRFITLSTANVVSETRMSAPPPPIIINVPEPSRRPPPPPPQQPTIIINNSPTWHSPAIRQPSFSASEWVYPRPAPTPPSQPAPMPPRRVFPQSPSDSTASYLTVEYPRWHGNGYSAISSSSKSSVSGTSPGTGRRTRSRSLPRLISKRKAPQPRFPLSRGAFSLTHAPTERFGSTASSSFASSSRYHYGGDDDNNWYHNNPAIKQPVNPHDSVSVARNGRRYRTRAISRHPPVIVEESDPDDTQSFASSQPRHPIPNLNAGRHYFSRRAIVRPIPRNPVEKTTIPYNIRYNIRLPSPPTGYAETVYSKSPSPGPSRQIPPPSSLSSTSTKSTSISADPLSISSYTYARVPPAVPPPVPRHDPKNLLEFRTRQVEYNNKLRAKRLGLQYPEQPEKQHQQGKKKVWTRKMTYKQRWSKSIVRPRPEQRKVGIGPLNIFRWHGSRSRNGKETSEVITNMKRTQEYRGTVTPLAASGSTVSARPSYGSRNTEKWRKPPGRGSVLSRGSNDGSGSRSKALTTRRVAQRPTRTNKHVAGQGPTCFVKRLFLGDNNAGSTSSMIWPTRRGGTLTRERAERSTTSIASRATTKIGKKGKAGSSSGGSRSDYSSYLGS
ncbi:hypothetical protein QBC43DRAFT_360184 [Cladorrhinum sp. PSN259]|nr:hypothetical protein QBC43DRAFT_360184 [Cladorrhinum sp. PSN259]